MLNQFPYFIIGTVSPLWESPWPYSISACRLVIKRYRLAVQSSATQGDT